MQVETLSELLGMAIATGQVEPLAIRPARRTDASVGCGARTQAAQSAQPR